MKKILLIAVLFFSAFTARAENVALYKANNQFRITTFLENQKLNYPNTNYYPLYAMRGWPYGVDLEFSKTMARYYATLGLTLSNASLSYTDSNRGLSNAGSYLQTLQARFGYIYYPHEDLALTPYMYLDYQHWQLDTGGRASTSMGARINGITQITQALQSGVGLLAQWAATQRLVLGADILLYNDSHAWTFATLPYLGNFIYLQTPLAQEPSWSVALSADYRLSEQLHGLLGFKYREYSLGAGQNNAINRIVPRLHDSSLQYSAGLAYELDSNESVLEGGDNHKLALSKANNQASLETTVLFQNYGEIHRGRPGYLDRQSGHLPQLTFALHKTWHHLYGQFALSEALGNTRYDGADVFTNAPLTATISNTMTDLSGRLGYQFSVSANTAFTPYAILGYHRWLRAISYPETYHHNWYGWGAMLQWAPTSSLVLDLDGNLGRSYNAQVHTWNTFYPPNTVIFRSSLGSRSYLMLGAGSDLQIDTSWHLLAKLNYWRFNYGEAPPVNAQGDHEPTSNTRFLAMTLGLGYSF